jgi:uncharacterized coiled-coil protein SlyX
MNRKAVEDEIWLAMKKYYNKLTFEERSDLAVTISGIITCNEQSTPDFARIMTLESEVLRQGKLITDLTDQLYFEASRINEQDDKLEKLNDLSSLTSDVNKAGVLCRAVGDIVDKHTGQIAELTEQVKTLHAQLAAVADDHSGLKKCIEEFATNVYQKLM